MANSLTHSLPYPVKNARFTLPLSFRTSAGTPTDPTTPDTELSSDGGATFADCTEEITTGGTNGWGYLTLTGAETNNNVVLIAAKSANCLTTPAVLYPRVLPVLLSGTASAGGSTSITLAAGAYDLTGCIVRTTGGTGGGGTGGANNQARVITAYNTSTLVATISPAWETNPDATTTYDVLLTDMAVNSPVTRALRPTTDGRTLVVDANGLADANVVKLGPTGSGTAQTARDIGASVLLSSGAGAGQLDFTSGVVKASLVQILGTALTETAGQIAAGFKKFFDIASPTSTMNRITLVDTCTTNTDMRGTDSAALAVNWTAARAGYIDNLNVGGAVASHADILALNQSASKHLLIQTVGQYERPESGSVVYTVEVRTFSASTGAAVDADSDPTLTAAGQTSGSLNANIGTLVHPATGVYRWPYTVASGATNEPIRFDVSATVSAVTYTLSCYTQVVDLVSATWTSTDAAHLTAVFNKLPTNNIADETLVIAAIGTPMQAGSTVVLTDGSLTTAKLGTFVIAKTTNVTGFNDIAATAVVTGGAIATSSGAVPVSGDFTATMKTSLNAATVNLANGAIKEASFTVPGETTGAPTGVLGWIRRCFERSGNKRTRNRSDGSCALRNAADNGNLETWTQSTASTVDTVGKAA